MIFHHNHFDLNDDDQGDLGVAHISSVIDIDFESSVGDYHCIRPLTLV